METRRLGLAGPTVSAIGLGCFGMSGAYNPVSEDESLATIRLALDLGCTFFDTADVYDRNEQLLGRALGRRRAEAVIATKFGSTPAGPNGRPDYVSSSCDESLRRLGSDYVDLYYLHRVDPSTPIEETVAAMADLVTKGKVRYLGLSEAGPETIHRAHAVHPLAAVQSEYSLLSRDVEVGVLPTVRELGIGFVAASPLGRGLLTGAIKSSADLRPEDSRHQIPRFSGENLTENLSIADDVVRTAVRADCTATQLALAWLLGQPGAIVPIPGASRGSHLRENLMAAMLCLSKDEVERVSELIPAGHGDRLTPEGMTRINR